MDQGVTCLQRATDGGVEVGEAVEVVVQHVLAEIHKEGLATACQVITCLRVQLQIGLGLAADAQVLTPNAQG